MTDPTHPPVARHDYPTLPTPPEPPGYQRAPHYRLMLGCAAAAAVLAVGAAVVNFGPQPDPKLPSVPGLPSGLPTGLPGLPSGLPTGLPTDLPTDLPTGLPPGLPTGSPPRLPTGLPGLPGGSS
ncbi:hypothetical protein [Streptomyces orinoci]|uniref:Uncharacterized protein n=1 Tax=Streptomyces orinoci TaxID=67339 RepID=A0ABV3K4P8_STRON|nr:hypothetical protein [Streptomyces orinoci]